MRRRVLAAVLFALALVVVVLARTGDTNQRGAEVTEGKPWTGAAGVTQSVAQLAARHDVAEPRPVGPEADQEAVRERAVAGSQQVREKPEPGEEGLPPRTAGPVAPQQRVGRSAIGPRSSLSEGTSFLGADSIQSGFIPPDSMGSVGPDQILVSVNGVINVYDKQGNLGGLHISDSMFWNPVLPPGVEPTDPGVEYDRLSGRWIVSAIDTESSNNRVLLAVSSGPTITNKTDFTFFSFNEADPPPAGPSRFVDYPQLGVDANAIYIGVNEFSSITGPFTGTSAFVIRKSSVTGGGPIVVTAFRGLATGVSAGPESPQPATDMDPNVAEGYIVGPDSQLFNRLDVRRITDPGGTPSISGNLTVTVPSTSLPLAVPAQGTSGGLDPLDDRLFEAMVARGPDGSDSLWTVHNITVNSSGVGTSSGNRDGARWYQLGTLASTPSLIQSGTLFDRAASNPRFFWIPSIAMNGQGHASLNSSTAGVGRFAEIASSGRLATDPLGTTEPFDLTQASTTTYNLGTGSPKRWGDYSQTVVDPTDNQTFWSFQEYASGTNSWGVRVIQLKAPPPAVPASASPNTILPGQSSVQVTITGTAQNGSGFFDPGPDTNGPGFAHHISASVSGGVVVNSVAYTDPTHITLDLDTTGATNGSQSVTVTNPDGQSDSCSPLVVGTDTTAPAAPNPQGTTPGSPANDTSPLVFGTNAECGSTVSLYTDSSCSDLAASGSATSFGSPGIPVTVPPNSTTTFYAKAMDVSDNPSPCSTAFATYVEDSTPPAVSVDSGPSGTTSDQAPTFTFSATDSVGPITFQCSIDTGTPSFGACSGPGNSDTPGSALADGPYTFRVQGTDAAGNSAVATRSFSVATPKPPGAPETTITKGPKKTTKRRPKFKFSASQAGSTFQCKLDRGSFAPCSSPFLPPSKLKPGKHVLRVMAIGPSGATDSSPAVRKFKVIA